LRVAINIFSRLKIIDSPDLVFSKQERLTINDISSGEYNILINLLKIALAAADDCLILIDEPEISLHPEWQIRYIDFVNTVLRPFSNFSTIIATHSPLIISTSPAD